MIRPVEPTEVRLQLLSTADDSSALDEVLDDAERARAAGFVDGAGRARFRVGAALVRMMAAEHDDCGAGEVTVDRTCLSCGAQHGKPRIVGSGLRVSVTHAGPHVLVASAVGRDLGVDLDRVDPAHADEVGRALGGSWADADDLTMRWVRAEAVTKVGGGSDLVLVELDAPAGYRAALAVTGVAPVTPVPRPRPPNWPQGRGR